MRNIRKSSTLESKFPLLAVEQGCIISKDGDITVAYEVTLPEIFTVTSQEYESVHAAWCKAIKVLPEDDNLLDNQDLCLLFKVSIKTLQRYRAIGVLPYFTLSGKVYYRASDVRAFIKERFNAVTLRKFEKEHCAKKKK